MFPSTNTSPCSPLPSSGYRGRSFRKPCGSPPSLVLWGRKTARHLSATPPVVPWGPVPPDVRGIPLGVGGDGELSSVPGSSLWSLPWARDPDESARPRNNGRGQILPSARLNTLASQCRSISGLILTACFLVVYASHPPVARRMATLATGLLASFDRTGLAPVGFQ